MPETEVALFLHLFYLSHFHLCKIRNLVDSLQVIQSEINVVLKGLFGRHLVCSPRCQHFLSACILSSSFLWVLAHVYLTSPFISILGLLLCDKKDFLFSVKGQFLKMCKCCEWGWRPKGKWMNARFTSLWDFTLILKGCRDPQSSLVRNNDLPLRSNLKLERGGWWCIIPANAQCH